MGMERSFPFHEKHHKNTRHRRNMTYTILGSLCHGFSHTRHICLLNAWKVSTHSTTTHDPAYRLHRISLYKTPFSHLPLPPQTPAASTRYISSCFRTPNSSLTVKTAYGHYSASFPASVPTLTQYWHSFPLRCAWRPLSHTYTSSGSIWPPTA